VQPAHGAFPEMIRATGGGILVKPDDAGALAEGIWQLFQDRRRRLTIGRHGSGEVRAHYGVKRSAEWLEAALQEAVGKERLPADAGGHSETAKVGRAAR
jgi:glycosyltransferase involved in cell wall biosynthesis